MKSTGLLCATFGHKKRATPKGGSNVPKHDFLRLVDDVFTLANGNIEFFRQRLEANAVDQPAFQKRSVSLVVNVLVNHIGDLAVGVFHHIVTTISFFFPLKVMVCKQCEDGRSIFWAAYPPYWSQDVAQINLNGFTRI